VADNLRQSSLGISTGQSPFTRRQIAARSRAAALERGAPAASEYPRCSVLCRGLSVGAPALPPSSPKVGFFHPRTARAAGAKEDETESIVYTLTPDHALPLGVHTAEVAVAGSWIPCEIERPMRAFLEEASNMNSTSWQRLLRLLLYRAGCMFSLHEGRELRKHSTSGDKSRHHCAYFSITPVLFSCWLSCSRARFLFCCRQQQHFLSSWGWQSVFKPQISLACPKKAVMLFPIASCPSLMYLLSMKLTRALATSGGFMSSIYVRSGSFRLRVRKGWKHQNLRPPTQQFRSEEVHSLGGRLLVRLGKSDPPAK